MADVGYWIRAGVDIGIYRFIMDAPLDNGTAIAPAADGRSFQYRGLSFEEPIEIEVQRIDRDGRRSEWVPVTVEIVDPPPDAR